MMMTLALTGPWSIEQVAFSGLQAIAGLIPYGERITPRRGRPDRDGVLQIDVRGVHSKHGGSSLIGSWGDITDAITEATLDPTVRGVLVVIDSPGGSVAGAAELSDAVAALSARKPVVAFIEDLGSGTSVWFASQARKVFANSANAVTGGVGVSMGIYDRSKAAEKDGVTPVMIRTGELKGAGFPGSTVTEKQVAMWQNVLNSSFDLMATTIRRARPGITSTQWTTIAEGGVFSARRAIELGLVDKVCSYDQALEELRSMISSRKETTTTMVTTPVSTPGTVTRSTTHIVAQPVVSPTISAVATWNAAIAELKASGKNESDAVQHVVKSRPDLHQAFLAESNNRPVPAFATAFQSARHRWDSTVAELVSQGRSQQEAASEVVRTNPGLYREYLTEANSR